MAENVRINSLPEDATPVASDVVPIDGLTTRKTTLADLVNAGRPLASQAEAEAGVEATKAMTALTTKQAIAALAASPAQGDKADTAVQPGDLSTVATSGSYGDLANLPTLGTAAAADTGDFATAVQGTKADSALQSADIGDSVQAFNARLQSLAEATDGTTGQVLARTSDGSLEFTDAGAGDMLSSAYDPDGKGSDAFAMENMTEGVDAKIMTAAERDKLTGVPFASRAAATLTNIASSISAVTTYGYAAAGDGGGGRYVRVGGEPSHAGKFQSSDGAWWELAADQVISDRMFGVKADATFDGNDQVTGGTDDTAAMQAFAAYIKYRGGNGHYVLDGGSRRVWTSPITHLAVLMDIIDCQNYTIEYLNDARIVPEYPDPTGILPSYDPSAPDPIYGSIWRIDGYRDATFIRPKLKQNVVRAGAFDYGVIQFHDRHHGRDSCRRLRILDVDQTGGVGCLIIGPLTALSADSLHNADNEITGHTDSVYYPCTMQGNGDNLKVDLECRRCVRSLFVYNTSGVRGKMKLVQPCASTGNINIGVNLTTNQRNVMRGVDLDIEVEDIGGFETSGTVLLLNVVRNNAGVNQNAKLENMDIRIKKAGNGSDWRLVHTRKYDNVGGGGGGADDASRAYLWKDIKVSVTSDGATHSEPISFFVFDNWTGATLVNIGLYDCYYVGTGTLGFDGRGVQNYAGRFFIRNSVFGLTPNFTNHARKKAISNSDIGGSYRDQLSSPWYITYRHDGRVRLEQRQLSVPNGSPLTVTLPLSAADDGNFVEVTPCNAAVAVRGIHASSNTITLEHSHSSAVTCNVAVTMGY